MNKISFLDISSYSIIIPFVLSLFLLNKKATRYLPMILVIWLGTLYELMTITIIDLKLWSNVYINIYVLIESLLLILQFQLWDNERKSNKGYYLLYSSFIAIWLANNFFEDSAYPRTSMFIVVSSLAFVLKSIHQINITFYSETKNLLSNPVFLLCSGFIIFFCYAIIVELFWNTVELTSMIFKDKVYNILLTVNLIANFIYACAFSLLLIKSKPKENFEPVHIA